jgi:hypothetical protein
MSGTPGNPEKIPVFVRDPPDSGYDSGFYGETKTAVFTHTTTSTFSKNHTTKDRRNQNDNQSCRTKMMCRTQMTKA